MIDPPSPCSRMRAAAARDAEEGAADVDTEDAVELAGVRCSRRKFENTPALFTSTSSRPKRSTTVPTSRSTSASPRRRLRRPRRALLRRPAAPCRVEPVGTPVGEHDRGSRLGEPPAHAKPKPWAAPVTSADLAAQVDERGERTRRCLSRHGRQASRWSTKHDSISYKIIGEHARGEEPMATLLIGYDTESAAVGEGLARFLGPDVPQYRLRARPRDTRRGVALLARLHEEPGRPARSSSAAARSCTRPMRSSRCAGSALFDIQQHTYSHVVFRDVHYRPSRRRRRGGAAGDAGGRAPRGARASRRS